MNNKANKILDFWKICELGDVDRFILNDSSPIKSIFKAKFNNIRPARNILSREIKYPKVGLTTVFYGLIKIKDIVKILQNELNDQNEFKEIELEELNPNEYTYIAKYYANSPYDSLCLDGVVLHINPIFYILKNLNDSNRLNNQSFDEYNKNINQELMVKYPYDIKSKYVFIPDYEYLKNIIKYKNILTTIFNIENNALYLREDIYNKLKNNPNAADFISQVDTAIAKNNKNIMFFKANSTIEKDAIQIAKNNPRDFIYLCSTNFELDDQEKYPINFTVNNYIKDLYKLTHSFSKISHEQLLNELDKLKEDLKIANFNEIVEPYVKIDSIRNLKDINQISDVNLMSFYINALSETPSEMTKKFILGTQIKNDVNNELEIKKKINALNIFKCSSARWVSKFSPNYAQQAAINLFLKNYGKGENIFSVNGPPGTGKTTLLKDVIANIIVKKAQQCIDLGLNIFEEKTENNYKFINEKLIGKYEIFVVSNNNKAVENISLELPKYDSMDFAYIGKQKEDFLFSQTINEFYDFDSWGLISSRLGNFENINNFKKSLDKLKADGNVDINILLRKLVNKFNNLKEEIENDENNFQEILNIDENETQNNIKNASVQELKLQEEFLYNEEQIDQLNGQINSIQKDSEILNEKIILLENSLTLKEKILKIFFKDKQNKILNSKLELNSNKKLLKDLEDSKQNYQQKIQNNHKTINEIKEKVIKLQSNLKCLKNVEYFLPNDDYFSHDYKNIQLNSLFNKKDYLENKAKLFFVSLQILEALCVKNLGILKENINDYFNNRAKTDLSKADLEKVKNGFYSLFFITPVASSSLAASYNMIKKINNFGTLLCDESGQATPQSLVGVLNRAQNALIVGDPLQVEPVFTAPSPLINSLQEVLNIEDVYNPLKSSAQKLADLANEYGSYYKINDKNEWVGMPLAVHRRCINPMFDIANAISYNNKMVLPNDVKADADLKNLPESCWINVVSNANDFPNNGNSSIKEKEAFEIFFERYQNDLKDNFYIISPFKSIKFLEFNIDNANERIGTIHTFQGKEAPVVFFLLGGNVTRNAKAWVASKANILNVAVTRAKQRIYIIGDAEKWQQLNFFNTVIELLDIKEIKEIYDDYRN